MRFGYHPMTAFGGFVEASPQYELIEEITIDTDVTEVVRNKDPNGVNYDFSAVAIYVSSPAHSAAASNDVLIFNLIDKNNNYLGYQEQVGGIGTTKRTCVFKARNDSGLYEAYSFHNATSTENVYTEYSFGGYLWRNVAKIILLTYPSSKIIPAGTTIKIYGIRG